MFRRWLAVLCMTLALCCVAAACAEGDFAPIPAALKFTQKLTTTHLNNNRAEYVTYPTTCLSSVNEEVRAVVDSLLAEGRTLLPARGGDRIQTRLDVGSYIHQLGTRWMSFMTVGRLSHEGVQLWVNFDTRVYNMESGEQITLDQVIDGEKGGWSYLQSEVQKRLFNCFPDIACNLSELMHLTSAEAIRQTPFTLSAGHLSLIFRADALYEGKTQLFHVDFYYPELWPYMTDQALVETDCSAYQLIAFTYDDGPARGSSDALMNTLRVYGADATFFVVGEMAKKNTDILLRENDAGFAVQSHNYVHITEGLTGDKIRTWKAQMDELMLSLLGRKPDMMRTPGGMDDFYIRAEVNLPLIHWSRISGDADANAEIRENPDRIANRVAYAKDGEIILCHDLNSKASAAASTYLETMRRRDIMLVTVQDLCVLRGITLEPNKVLWIAGDDSAFGK